MGIQRAKGKNHKKNKGVCLRFLQTRCFPGFFGKIGFAAHLVPKFGTSGKNIIEYIQEG